MKILLWLSMKIPLKYQSSEFDCATTSFLNAINYLFSTEEINPEIIKMINLYTMDLSDEFKNPYKGGTSRKAIEKLTFVLNKYPKKFNLYYQVLKKEEVRLEKMEKCLDNNGVILIRCYQSVEHYVIITKIKKKWVYIFDPYYISRKKYKDKSFKIILNKPFLYNIKVKIERLFEENKKDFSLGSISLRQCVLLNKIKR